MHLNNKFTPLAIHFQKPSLPVRLVFQTGTALQRNRFSRMNFDDYFFFQVKAILVNVFGGIVNCATIANGITNAAKNINLSLPLVVRLEGKSTWLCH